MRSAEVLLPAIAYADALGLPYETRSHATMRNELLTGLAPVDGHIFFPEAPIGTWSDDTQQSLAVASSLAERGEFDVDDIAQRLVDEYQVSAAGWGSGTIAVMQALEVGVPLHEASPPCEFEGGCGALMRMTPLVWWQQAKGLSLHESDRQIESLARITHNNDTAVLRAIEHGRMMRGLLSGEYSPATVQDVLAEDSHIRETLQAFQDIINDKTRRYELLFSSLDRPDKPFGGTDVLLMVYAALKVDDTYDAGLRHAIRLGGDTDSTAAIFAGLSFAVHGAPESWPPADAGSLQRPRDLYGVARQFADALS